MNPLARLGVLLLLRAVSAAAQPVQVVVPNQLANVEGNSSASDVLTASSFRLQMVFAASQFPLSSAPNVTNSLTRISFRIDGASTFDVLSSFGGASVSLSTTPRGPDNLSPVFAENSGANRVTIYSGAIAIGGAHFPGQSPEPFGNGFTAITPFYYSPAQGNLLIDIRGVGGQVLFPGAMDAQATTGDAVSWVFATSNLATVGTADTLGLVAHFDFVVIPEPNLLLLLLPGLAAAWFLRRGQGGREKRSNPRA
jgi:hypothetical protein